MTIQHIVLFPVHVIMYTGWPETYAKWCIKTGVEILNNLDKNRK